MCNGGWAFLFCMSIRRADIMVVRQRHFVLLDRDGTLIMEKHYLSDPAQVELIPGAVTGLKRLSDWGVGLVVITNQSGIGREMFTQNRLVEVHDRMCNLLLDEGISLDGIFYCPHLPGDGCECRKPRPGLIRQAAQKLHFDPASNFMIGDKVCDVDAGLCSGATSFLVRTGYGKSVEKEGSSTPDYIVDDVDAASLIIGDLIGCNKFADN